MCVGKGVSSAGKDVGKDAKGTDVDKGDGALNGSSGAGTRCSGRVKVKLNVPLMRAGTWGNVLVRADWLEYDPDRRAGSAPNVPELSKRERRRAENVECIGGFPSWTENLHFTILLLVINYQITLHFGGFQKIINFSITRFGLCRIFFVTIRDSASFVHM